MFRHWMPSRLSGLKREALSFAMGGVLGFVVDAGIVELLTCTSGLNPYVARVPSFMLAATVTWQWNRHLTFARRRGVRRGDEWLRWMLVMSAGAAINYGTYAALVAGLPVVHDAPWIGVAAGSLVAAAVNFMAARSLVFKQSRNGL